MAAIATACLTLIPSAAPPAFAAAPPGGIIQGPARVVDGDTLVINEQRIRLYGIDAPEKAQTCTDPVGRAYSCGMKSKEALTAKVGSQVVTCTVKNQDQYGRNVSTCAVGGPLGGEELNSWLVSNGYAVAYRQFGKEYIPLEDKAKAERRGVWAGDFTPPNEWRKQQKGADGGAAAAAPAFASVASLLPPPGAPSCPGGALPIKGNIGSKGDKIYHVPGGRLYEQVKIDVADGERWFCTEQEAQAAGWRAAK
eukprot:CAMPEP_0202890424 /NCGR_PEP_ID=MMETSP1392-20130828/828_1 /ASSEMBLY_ACC=CAM_ASM_000868 /TAXON_ID=225041 /ORGANISM="Chlamydomonas chlamydogama, Strain SAG 11-48b" /LENGTH=251 /DNA_ID=CAMNT_0049573985 /DNA_START=238 /DNA_END=993 /DNA_ORIENTATION=-